MEISFSPPDIGQAEIDAVIDTLRSDGLQQDPILKNLRKKLLNIAIQIKLYV